MKPTFIIAEAGANHNRDWATAKKLVDGAVHSKCDAVKFQTYTSETLYSKNTPNFAGYKNINELIKSLELPRHWQKDLKKYCDDNQIEFMSTPFDEKAVDELYAIGVKRLKIAGFEATDPRFVRYVASTKLPLIITAGIGCSLETVKNIYNWVLSENPNPDITFLHGNNAYPTPLKDINLGQILEIKSLNLPISVGLSDHTEGILVPPLGVALGASTIEKHFTLDRNMSGPDHPFAIEVDELCEMVKNIRATELTLNVKSGEYTESESLGFHKARRSVVASKEIRKGEVIKLEHITTKRPFLDNCISAINYYDVVGKTAKRTILCDDILEYGDIE